MTTKTKQYIVMVETTDGTDGDTLHELLCTVCHEEGIAATDAMYNLTKIVTDIQVVGAIEQTG